MGVLTGKKDYTDTVNVGSKVGAIMTSKMLKLKRKSIYLG